MAKCADFRIGNDWSLEFIDGDLSISIQKTGETAASGDRESPPASVANKRICALFIVLSSMGIFLTNPPMCPILGMRKLIHSWK